MAGDDDLWDSAGPVLPDVVSSDDAWLWIAEPNCPFDVRTYNIIEGRLVAFPKPCDSWRCRECAERRAAIVRDEASYWFDRAGSVCVNRYPTDDTLRPWLRQRRKRLSSPGDHEFSYLAVDQGWPNEPMTFVFADFLLGQHGGSEGGHWMSALDALRELVRVALPVPGINRLPSAGGEWRLQWSSTKSAKVSVWLRTLDNAEAANAFKKAGGLFAERTGCPEPVYGEPFPERRLMTSFRELLSREIAVAARAKAAVTDSTWIKGKGA